MLEENINEENEEPIFQRRRNRTKTQVSKGGSIISKKIIRYLDEPEHSDAIAKIRQMSNMAKEKSSNEEQRKISNDANEIELQKNTERNRLMFKNKEKENSENNFNRSRRFRNKYKNNLQNKEKKIEESTEKKIIDKKSVEDIKKKENKDDADEPIFQRRRNRTKTQVNKSGSIFGQKIIRYLDEPEHSDAIAKIRQISNKAKEKSSNNDKPKDDVRKNTEINRLMFKNKDNDISENKFNEARIKAIKNKPKIIEDNKKIDDNVEEKIKNKDDIKDKSKKIDKSNEENKKDENEDEEEPIFQRRRNRTKTQVSKGGSIISKKIIRYLDEPEHSDAIAKIRQMSNMAKENSSKNLELNDSDLPDNTERNRLLFKNKEKGNSEDKDKNDNNLNKSKGYKNMEKKTLKNDIEDSKEKKIFDKEENKKEEDEEPQFFQRRKNRTKTQVSKSGIRISEKIIRYLDDPEHSEALSKVRILSKKAKRKKQNKNVHAHFNEPKKNKVEDNTEKNSILLKSTNEEEKKTEIKDDKIENRKNDIKTDNKIDKEKDTKKKEMNFNRRKQKFSTQVYIPKNENISLFDEIKSRITNLIEKKNSDEFNLDNLNINSNKKRDKKGSIDYGEDNNNEKNKNENKESNFQRRKNRTKTQVSQGGSVFGQRIIRYLDDPEHSEAIAKIREISNKAKEMGSRKDIKRLPKEKSQEITLPNNYNNDNKLEINNERKSFMPKNKENNIFDDKNKDKIEYKLNRSTHFRNRYRRNLKKEDEKNEDSNEKRKIIDKVKDEKNNKEQNEENKKEEEINKEMPKDIKKEEEINKEMPKERKKEKEINEKEPIKRKKEINILKESPKEKKNEEEDFEPIKFERRKNRTKTQVAKSGIKISKKIIRYLDDPEHSEAIAKVRLLSKNAKNNSKAHFNESNINKLEGNAEKKKLLFKDMDEENNIPAQNPEKKAFIRRTFQFPTQSYIPKNKNISLFDEIKSKMNKNKIIESKDSDEFNLDNLNIYESIIEKKESIDEGEQKEKKASIDKGEPKEKKVSIDKGEQKEEKISHEDKKNKNIDNKKELSKDKLNENYNTLDVNKSNRVRHSNLRQYRKLNNDNTKDKKENINKSELKEENKEKINLEEEKSKNKEKEKEIINDNKDKGAYHGYRRRFYRYRNINNKLQDNKETSDNKNYNTINYKDNNDYKKNILGDENSKSKTIEPIPEEKEKRPKINLKSKSINKVEKIEKVEKKEKEENPSLLLKNRFSYNQVISKNEKPEKQDNNNKTNVEKERNKTIENKPKELNRSFRYGRRFFRTSTDNKLNEKKPKEEIIIEKKTVIKVEEENNDKIKDKNKEKVKENKMKETKKEETKKEESKKPNYMFYRRRRFFLRNNESKEKEKEKEKERYLTETNEEPKIKIKEQKMEKEKPKIIYSKKIKVEEKRPSKEVFGKSKDEKEYIKQVQDKPAVNNPYSSRYKKQNIRINTIPSNLNNLNDDEDNIKNNPFNKYVNNSRNKKFYKPIKTDSELIDDFEKIEDYNKNTYLKDELLNIYNNITEEYSDFKHNVFYTNINSFEVNVGEFDKGKIPSYQKSIKADDLCKGRVTTDDILKKYSMRAKYKMMKKK